MPPVAIVASLRPLLLILRIAGLCLFTFDPKFHRTRVTLVDVACIVFTSLLNIVINLGFLLSSYDPGIHALAMMKYSLPVLMYINHLIDVFAMLWIFAKRNHILAILSDLADIDEELTRIGGKIDHVRNERSLKILTLLMLFCAVALSCWCGLIHGLHADNIDVLFQFFSLWIFLCSLAMWFQFLAGIVAISQRYSALAAIFYEILPKHVKRLHKICELYLRIADVIYAFNRIYGLLLTLYFGNSFCWLCLSIFSTAMITKFDITHICTIFCVILHSCITITACFCVVRAAERLNSEREVLMRSSYKKINEFDEHFGFCVKVSQLQTQINDVSVKFSCGFFDINWSFVFKFFSSGVMYFIILVQFEKSLSA